MISLIMATLGRSTDVARFIGHLRLQSDPRYELIIVDQNSDDRLVPIVQRAVQDGVNVIHLRMDRPSLSGARNLGLEHASGEVVAFPDDDCWYESGTVETVLGAFEKAEELQGVVACWVEQAAAKGEAMTFEPLSLDAWRSFRGGDASSISLFFRRDLFLGLGGFDERLGVGRWYGAGEETDLVLRALTSGARIERNPMARVHHLYQTHPDGPWRQIFHNARRRARGTGALYAKHGLSGYVIFRGLVAPLLRPASSRARLGALSQGFATSIGRLEGMLRWQIGEK